MSHFSIQFDITTEHINKGKKRCPRDCAINLALRDRFPGFEIGVGGQCVVIYHRKKPYRLVGEMDVALNLFRIHFDSLDPVRPGRYQLDLEIKYY